MRFFNIRIDSQDEHLWNDFKELKPKRLSCNEVILNLLREYNEQRKKEESKRIK